MIAHSQLAPLPSKLPFRIVSKTIGQGAYACIKKAIPLDKAEPVFAVKFIHKEYAIRHGRLTKRQIALEIQLHSLLKQHANIVQFFMTDEDQAWRWIAMELAEGGDLFDKIESDVGVGEDIAHLYFTQLISAVTYMHSKGVGHRDIKPENILLSAEGNLKIADFGLATLFEYQGVKKLCATSCGSPPYTAPEVVTCDARAMKKLDRGYYGDLVDIWSCGVVLFVLLVGNTPWDEPLDRSYEFNEYVKTNGHPDDELWQNLPTNALTLLRGMMNIKAEERLPLAKIRLHPWFLRQNPYLSSDGSLENPVGLATQMFESMKIDFSHNPVPSQFSADSMDIDSQQSNRVPRPNSPPSTSNDIMFDYERPSINASQMSAAAGIPIIESNWDERLAEEPSFSQFSSTPQVPLTRTQFARRFGDILPSHSLTRFYSVWQAEEVYRALSEALDKLSITRPENSQTVSQSTAAALGDGIRRIKIRTSDTRNCLMSGDIVIENMPGMDGQLLEVNFVKAKGDPVEWRRLFKKVVVLCKDAVFKPEEHMTVFSQ